VTPGTIVTLVGREGPWRFLGQATYVDDDGRTVEHDWVRVVQDDEEVWVAPEDVVVPEVRSMPLHVLKDDHAA
jgi:hypothetical protein